MWLDTRGWVRLDPTTAVAPQRIEQGADSYLAQLQSATGISSRFNQWVLLRQMRLRLDSINYQWHRWVLGYDNQLQFNLVKQLLGGVDSWRIALLFLLAGAMAIFPFALMKLWRSRVSFTDSNRKSVAKLEKKLLKFGLSRTRDET